MKKISKLAGFVAAAALLCGISGCDNSETITMTTTKIEMVGDPIVTGKAVIFQWKDSGTNDKIVITRQASGEEEVTIAEPSSNVFTDRVTYENLLEAGVEYTYRFYNKIDFSSGRTTEYTGEMKYSCVERKVKFEKIDPAGTKLAPITEEQVTIVKTKLSDKNYVSVDVEDEKESCVWIDLYDYDDMYYDYETESYQPRKYKDLEWDRFEYDPTHTYKIVVGKYWPGRGEDDERYYSNADTSISFDLPATVAKENDVQFDINSWDGTFKVYWSGKKDSKYEISFEAFDNKDEPVTLKSFTIADDKITRDNFFNCLATGKLSDLIDTTKLDTVKTAKATVKEMVTGKTASESVAEYEIPVYYTKYTSANNWLNISGVPDSYNEDKGEWTYKANITLYGANLPATAKLYYKLSDDVLYTEVSGGLKKNDYGELTATVSIELNTEYDFKAVVTTDNKNWYDWEEGKTEEVATRLEWQY